MNQSLACKQGHPWTDATTYIRKNGTRVCQACVNVRSLKWLKDRYRSDPEWREKMKRLSRDRYYRNRAPNGKASKCHTGTKSPQST
jgi:hypothetical protein